MRTLDPVVKSDDEEDEDLDPPPTKWPCQRREFVAGALQEFLKKVKDCKQLNNDTGKFFLTPIFVMRYYKQFRVGKLDPHVNTGRPLT